MYQGEEVAAYPDDRPYPSYLVLYYINQRPIHVVVAVNSLVVQFPDPLGRKSL